MKDVQIPEDISGYKTKFVGPFTARESICFALGLVSFGLIYNIVKPYVGLDIAIYFAIPIAAIAWFFGWFKKYGMNAEEYVQSVFISNYVAPKKRVYRTENTFDEDVYKLGSVKKEKLSKQKLSEHPEYRMYQ